MFYFLKVLRIPDLVTHIAQHKALKFPSLQSLVGGFKGIYTHTDRCVISAVMDSHGL